MIFQSILKARDAARGLAGLAGALPSFFRERVTPVQAVAELKKIIGNRAETFLEIARTRIYGEPASPYLRLLKRAGCEFSDLRAQVLADGLEPTLERLARAPASI